jgi:CNT family concentrative nucleoside transporter
MPTILFFSALSAILYYLGVLQVIVRGLAWVMQRTMKVSGAESLAAAANVFVGQTEAPLTVRPFLDKMTRSELMALMTGGFATVAGGVMAVYVGMLKDVFPDIAGHLLAASVMSAPASFVMAKILIPETETPETLEGASIHVEKTDANLLDATSRGTSEGLKLAFNVAAMLIAFMALIPMLNWMVQLPGPIFGWVGLEGVETFFSTLSLEKMMGWIMGPLAFLMGVPWEDARIIGTMMGTKTIINEFVAYLQLAGALQAGTIANGKSVIIATYALCGFSNLASIGIQIGGLSVLAPTRRADLARIGFRAMIGASLACFQTAALAGMLL